MSVLHTINKTPASALLARCAASLRPGDTILFIEDGVYHCLEQSLLQEVHGEIAVYFLLEDLTARGLTEKMTARGDLADTRKFVELSTGHDKVISWF